MSYENAAKKILSNFKRIVVVGFSKNSEKAANYVPLYLMKKGYEVIPVNPTMDEYESLKVYPNLKSVVDDGHELEVVEIFRPSQEAEQIAQTAIKLGAKAVWLQKGIRSERAGEMARERNVLYVEDRCMYEDHRKFFG